MNKINGVETNEFVFEAAMQIIENIIKMASQYDGKLYGSFLRDVIIPRLKGKCLCNYNRVCLLFNSNHDATLFISKMKELYIGFRDIDHIDNSSFFELKINDLYIAKIIVSYNQIHDLDINQLAYYYKNDVVKDARSANIVDLNCELIKKIIDKKATILEDFIEEFLNYTEPKQNSVIYGWNCLLYDGWILNYKSLVITSHITLKGFLKQINQLNILKQFQEKQVQLEQCMIERDTLLKQCLLQYPNINVDYSSLKSVKDQVIEIYKNL